MLTHLSRPFRPIELGGGKLEFFELPRLAADLQKEDEYVRSGVAAITLARDEHVMLVLAALRKGATMREHRAPSAAAVVLLSGRVRFLAGETTELGSGSMAAFSADVPHAVEALEDSAYLLLIGGRDRHSSS